MIRTTLTDDIRDELNALHQSTKIGPSRLLKGKVDRPKGLKSTAIYLWMDGTLSTAKQSELEWDLNEWRTQSPPENFKDEDRALLDAEVIHLSHCSIASPLC